MRKPFYLPIVFLLIFVSYTAGHAQEEYTRLVPTKAQLEASEDHYYGLYAMENKIGWAQFRGHKGKFEDKPVYLMDANFQFRMAALGEVMKMKLEERYIFESDPAVIVCSRTLGVKTNGLVVIFDGAKVLPQLFIGSATICKNARIIWVKIQRLGVIFYGKRKLAEFSVSISPIIIIICIIGIQLNRLGKIP